MSKIKPTKTNRFNRIFEKCWKNLTKRELWDYRDSLLNIKPDIKYFYEAGYMQGKRDAKKEADE